MKKICLFLTVAIFSFFGLATGQKMIVIDSTTQTINHACNVLTFRVEKLVPNQKVFVSYRLIHENGTKELDFWIENIQPTDNPVFSDRSYTYYAKPDDFKKPMVFHFNLSSRNQNSNKQDTVSYEIQVTVGENTWEYLGKVLWEEEQSKLEIDKPFLNQDQDQLIFLFRNNGDPINDLMDQIEMRWPQELDSMKNLSEQILDILFFRQASDFYSATNFSLDFGMRTGPDFNYLWFEIPKIHKWQIKKYQKTYAFLQKHNALLLEQIDANKKLQKLLLKFNEYQSSFVHSQGTLIVKKTDGEGNKYAQTYLFAVPSK